MRMYTTNNHNPHEYALDRAERFSLDVTSPVPLYHQIEKVLLQRIARADALNRMLPSEVDLMTMFGVSRITVKKALDSLVAMGLLHRRRALGTRIVALPEITEELTGLTSYTEEMVARGLQIRTNVLQVSRHIPEPRIREKLGIGAREKTVSIRRLRGTTELFPVVILQTEIPASFGVKLTEDFNGSLYHILEDGYHIPILRAEEVIGAGKATNEEASLLEIAPGDSVLVMERLSFTHRDRPLEYVKGIYRPDRYKFSIRLKR